MSRRQLARYLATRAAMVVSLLLAAVAGGLVAAQLRPASHVVAAQHRARARVAPTSWHRAAPTAQHRAAPAVVLPTATRRPTATVPRPPTPSPTPQAPQRAILSPAGGPATPSGAWIRSGTVTLRVTLRAGTTSADLAAEVEIVPAWLAFSGSPSARSAMAHVPPGASTQLALVVPGLRGGERYRWRVRAVDQTGTASRWTAGGSFGVSTTAPAPPQLAATNMAIDGWSRTERPLFRWTNMLSQAPVSYYEYSLAPGGASSLSGPLVWQRVQGTVLTLAGWPEGYWRLRVRAVDLAGNHSRASVWDFGVATQSPAAPRFVSATPPQGGWSNVPAATLQLAPGPGVVPLREFQYALLGQPGDAAPPPWRSLTGPRLALPGLMDGDWRILVRAIDITGMASAPRTWAFHLDREHPLLTPASLSAAAFTPPVERLRVRSGLGKAASVGYVIIRAGRRAPVRSVSLGYREAGPIRDLVWDGRLDNKKMAPAGTYTMVIRATDAAGNVSELQTPAVQLLDKRIVISIHKEALWAYQGDRLVQYTLVTNGGPDTPTLPGIFHVEGKFTGFVFHSPWPRSSPFWYPDSPTSYALLYNAAGGYFLHDAPWRDNFGPGSNSVAGTPGGSYTGTHGCTNVPFDQMARLFAWADQGTLIQILP